MQATSKKEEQRFQGIGVSPGIARAVAVVSVSAFEEPDTYTIGTSDIDSERYRLERALAETQRQIVSLQNQVRDAAGADDASIFDSHLLVLEDPAVLSQVYATVEDEKINIEAAFYQVCCQYIESLRMIPDPYLRERAVDIQDVARRVLRNFRPGESTEAPTEAAARHQHVLFAHDLTPSDTAAMNRELVLGFATEAGSQTSHTAIMARGLNLPAIVGLADISQHVHTGDEVLLDGYSGLVIIRPSHDTIQHYQSVLIQKGELQESLQQLVDLPAETEDGFRLTLSANIEFAHEVENATRVGAEGVGLYRTEFFYINQVLLPEEDALAEDYGKVAREAAPHGVIIRTLDAGGDKIPGSTHFEPEPNPFLGWRGIRVCLEQTDLFQTQLRAILRASDEGTVSIMFPFIGTLEELRAAKEQVEIAKESLRTEGRPFDEKIQVGVMIELPSAVIIADALARECDFFSVGTNDLVQYTLAVDRVNERVAGLYQPHNPAVVRLLKQSADAAHKAGIWIGVCGEMASDILATPLLVGMGITELSVGSSQLPAVRRAVRSLSRSDCAALVEDVTDLFETEAIIKRCREVAEASYPELLA
ncbi:MAG: phosphotransferase system enzyme I (PtsI) [Verrucomicrobiales bacterium]|jgi:phosphotransferase system enzyme I (PtsI)